MASGEIQLYGAIALIAAAVVGALFAFLPSSSETRAEARLKAVAEKKKLGLEQKQATSGRLLEGAKDNRRKQVQETLKQIEDRERKRKRISLRTVILQAGLDLSVQRFWFLSVVTGFILALLPIIFGLPSYLGVLSGFVGLFGLPRWFLGILRKRRQETFLDDLPDAIDVMVRGLKAGLPVSDAMKVISVESGPPVGPEFFEIVEGQRIGITIDQGFERMFERIPIQEVNFLSIVMGVQAKSGGNLTETLGNLSRVLRDRRKMKAKVRSVSQEAKSSAAIIGCLPILIIVGLSFINPAFIAPLFTTTAGNTMLAACGVWMLVGILVMRGMISFEI